MSIWREKIDNETWLVGVSGRLDHLQTPDLESQLLTLVSPGDQRLIIDLAEVTYVNSGGLRCLVTIWRKAQQGSGIVVLSGINDSLMDLFTTVGFHKVFDIYPSSDEAKDALEVS
jgi:anti-sigma B factor antagonist